MSVESSGRRAAIVEATYKTFEREVERSQLPVLVDFGAPRFEPCRQVAPTLQQIAEEYQDRVKVVSVNTDKDHELAGRFNIESIPAVVLFSAGQPQKTLVGVRSKEEYLRHISPGWQQP